MKNYKVIGIQEYKHYDIGGYRDFLHFLLLSTTRNYFLSRLQMQLIVRFSFLPNWEERKSRRPADIPVQVFYNPIIDFFVVYYKIPYTFFFVKLQSVIRWFQIYLLVFNISPKPFNKDIVISPSFLNHAKLNTFTKYVACKLRRCTSATLVGINDFGLSKPVYSQACTFQSLCLIATSQ